jgi:hypothetical protein
VRGPSAQALVGRLPGLLPSVLVRVASSTADHAGSRASRESLRDGSPGGSPACRLPLDPRAPAWLWAGQGLAPSAPSAGGPPHTSDRALRWFDHDRPPSPRDRSWMQRNVAPGHLSLPRRPRANGRFAHRAGRDQSAPVGLVTLCAGCARDAVARA